MRKVKVIGLLLAVVLMAVGAYWGVRRVGKYFAFENMKAGVTQTAAPLTLAAARADCPISLPEGATNIQYAVWSLWQASQTFVRFEAPTSECLEHAQSILQPYAQRNGQRITSTNVVGPLPAPLLISPKDLSVAWFDLPQFSAGMVFGVSGGRAPTVWVDTNRGCFYYSWND